MLSWKIYLPFIYLNSQNAYPCTTWSLKNAPQRVELLLSPFILIATFSAVNQNLYTTALTTIMYVCHGQPVAMETSVTKIAKFVSKNNVVHLMYSPGQSCSKLS